MTAFRTHTPMRALVCLTVLLGSVPALAQSSGGPTTDSWVVVPVEPGDAEDPRATQLAVRLREALGESGVAVLDDTEAGEIVEERVSAPVSELSESDINAWASSSQAALRALARADYDNAREALVAAQEVAQRAAEELNREAERAREVLDTCLFTARVFLETHQRTEAERQVRSCRVLVPEVEPRRHRHPPEVHALLERIDAEETNGGLQVTSAPSGCTVRINGVPQGETPFAVEQLARGDYRLQVECSEEEHGRVHLVRVDEGTTRIHVDVGFDRALASRPFPRLTAPEQRLEHGRLLAAALGTTVVVVAAPGSAHVLRIDPDGRASQLVMPASGDVTVAATMLQERRSMDLTGDAPEPIDAPSAPGERPRLAVATLDDERAPTHDAPRGPGLPGWRIGLGIGVLAIGAGVLGASAYLLGDQGTRGDAYAAFDGDFTDPDFARLQLDWKDARAPFMATAAISGVLMGVGAGLLAPAREGMPWWGWVTGGVGLVLGVTAVILAAGAESCANEAGTVAERQACVDGRQQRGTASLVGFSALPFVAVSLSALIQSPDSDTQVAFVPSRDGASLVLGGRF